MKYLAQYGLSPQQSIVISSAKRADFIMETVDHHNEWYSSSWIVFYVDSTKNILSDLSYKKLPQKLQTYRG